MQFENYGVDPGPQTDEPARVLVRPGNQADGEPIGDGPARPETSAVRDRGRGRERWSPAVGEIYYTANPGYGYTLWTTNGGKFDPTYPETPKAKREYWAVNFSLDKRFANNWLAGFSYTWSRLTGNYSGLASSDEWGRSGPYVERYFDLWHMPYDKNLTPVDGTAQHRPAALRQVLRRLHPSLRFDVGAVVAAMSGTPVTEIWTRRSDYTWKPYGRGNLGRTPFLWLTNFYAEYSLKFGKTSLNFNVNVDNIFNIATIPEGLRMAHV